MRNKDLPSADAPACGYPAGKQQAGTGLVSGFRRADVDHTVSPMNLIGWLLRGICMHPRCNTEAARQDSVPRTSMGALHTRWTQVPFLHTCGYSTWRSIWICTTFGSAGCLLGPGRCGATLSGSGRSTSSGGSMDGKRTDAPRKQWAGKIPS